MRCPNCQFENQEGAKYCNECGKQMTAACGACGKENPPGSNFCNACGKKLAGRAEIAAAESVGEGERKQVTVLFCDLSGYTAMSERLDPEEVREIMSRIFGEIAQVVTKYEGFIEKFIGDAVVALFGVPKAHEDDPVRAIRAAREIHELIQGIDPQITGRIGEPLATHCGINTGVVITGQMDVEKGTHGVSGDTMNLASRLCSLARAGEILVGPETHRLAEGHFSFEDLDPATVKGKREPVRVYRVLSAKDVPVAVHRISGRRARLIGRKVELGQLAEAVQRLRAGKGSILSLTGDAGAGKSRLVEEFKNTLDLAEIRWLEGHAQAYSQNIPFFVLVDLLNRAWAIKETDSAMEIRVKIESNIKSLTGEAGDIVPFIGGLYALSYPEVDNASPEFWKSGLVAAVRAVLAALSQRGPVVVYLEDLHWADPSSVHLLRSVLSEFHYPSLFLCVYRPPFSLFPSHMIDGFGKSYREIRLRDLSPSETQDMMESLLRTEPVPNELRQFIQEKTEGNPFYLEEVIHALIESKVLLESNGQWRLARAIHASDIPPTIQGVISARLDRLEREAKRVLQEASVIGRVFLYDILDKITELKGHIDRRLMGLERLDLIRTRSLQPDLEYAFKHALTQEVVYNGLLRRERQELHERIGLVMERLFQDRLSEFFEPLAFHFKQGRSMHKAVDYLSRSGEKCLKRYAVEESHRHFSDAYDLLAARTEGSSEVRALLVDLLIRWAYVFYYRGDFRGLTDLLRAHQDLAESLDDKAKLGMFYGWFGMCLWSREKFEDSYQYLRKALALGEEIQDDQVIGYACAWLTWTCAELGRMDEALLCGERAQAISASLRSDHYLFFKSLGGMAHVYWYKGERHKALEAGQRLVEFGRLNANVRSMVMGHYAVGCSHFSNGDFPAAIESFRRAIQVSVDPYYSHIPRLLLGMSLVSNDQFQEAEEVLQEVVAFSQDYGAETIGQPAKMFLGVLMVLKGQLSQGMQALEEGRRAWLENGIRWRHVLVEYIMGKVYAGINAGASPLGVSRMARNIGFLLKNVPFAGKLAEEHLERAIANAREIGARGVLGTAYLELGLLHKAKGREKRAAESLAKAVQLLEGCGIEIHLKNAREALASLG